MELNNGERGGWFDARQSPERPLLGIIQEGEQFQPPESDVGSGQGMHIVAHGGLAAVVNRVDLPEAGLFSLLGGIEGADGDEAFQVFYGFGKAFPLQLERLLVLFQVAVNRRGAYPFELFLDFRRYAESLPLGDEGHLLAHQRSQNLRTLVRPHLNQKKAQSRRRQAITSSV